MGRRHGDADVYVRVIGDCFVGHIERRVGLGVNDECLGHSSDKKRQRCELSILRTAGGFEPAAEIHQRCCVDVRKGVDVGDLGPRLGHVLGHGASHSTERDHAARH